jgi:hypothetical protein
MRNAANLPENKQAVTAIKEALWKAIVSHNVKSPRCQGGRWLSDVCPHNLTGRMICGTCRAVGFIAGDEDDTCLIEFRQAGGPTWTAAEAVR